MRRIDYIVLHCSATVEGKDFDITDIDAWHKQRGWRGVGYHYVVKLDGKIQEGRDEKAIGAHVRGFNRNSIGICYVGGLGSNKAPKDTRTVEQRFALTSLICELKERYPDAKVLGHRDFSEDKNGNGIIEPFEWSKHCPCFEATEEYEDIY